MAHLVWEEGGALVLGDPETGERRGLGGPPLWCGTCGILRIGQSLFVGGNDHVIHRLDPPGFSPRRIADGHVVFAGPNSNELYVASVSAGAPQGDYLRRITTEGEPLAGPSAVPDGHWLTSPPRAVPGGILLESPPNSFESSIKMWDPASGRITTVGDGTRVIDVAPRRDDTVLLARTGRDCRFEFFDLLLTEPARGETRRVAPPGNDLEFIGGGGFSPDGTKLAAFSALNRGVSGGSDGGRRMQLVIVDVASGTVTPIDGSVGEFGEGYGFATWSPDGKWVFFGGLDDRAGAHRAGTVDAVRLPVPAAYSMVAVNAASDIEVG